MILAQGLPQGSNSWSELPSLGARGSTSTFTHVVAGESQFPRHASLPATVLAVLTSWYLSSLRGICPPPPEPETREKERQSMS